MGMDHSRGCVGRTLQIERGACESEQLGLLRRKGAEDVREVMEAVRRKTLQLTEA